MNVCKFIRSYYIDDRWSFMYIDNADDIRHFGLHMSVLILPQKISETNSKLAKEMANKTTEVKSSARLARPSNNKQSLIATRPLHAVGTYGVVTKQRSPENKHEFYKLHHLFQYYFSKSDGSLYVLFYSVYFIVFNLECVKSGGI